MPKETFLKIAFAPCVIGMLGAAVMHFGLSKQVLLHSSKQDAKTKKRIKLGYLLLIGGIALSAIAFAIGAVCGWL